MIRPLLATLLLAGCARNNKTPTPVATTVPVASVVAAPIEAPPPARIEDTQRLAVPGAGEVVLHAVGQLIEVTTPAGESWKMLEIERRVGNEVQRETIARPARSSRHAAKPGASYVYRARAAGAWSAEVTLRIGVPVAAPSAPTDVRARAETPFAVHIGWTATGVAAGFEIQQEKGEDYVRVAVLDPDAREFTHHFLLPGEVVRYRVRAFNAKAASDWEGAAVATSTGDGPSVPPRGPCIRLPARAPASSGCNPDITILQSPGGEPVSNVPGATNGCRRHLIAKYEGCTRELGTFEVQADVLAVEGHSNEGFPLLHAVMGAGEYTGARLATLQFRRGRYVEVDTAVFCGEERNDAESPALGTVSAEITSSSPPFETCQRDTPSF